LIGEWQDNDTPGPSLELPIPALKQGSMMAREIQTRSLKADVWKYFGFWNWRGKGAGQSRI